MKTIEFNSYKTLMALQATTVHKNDAPESG